jgi:hypothetical protein
MGDLEEEQVKNIAAEIKKMEKELNDDLKKLGEELAAITGFDTGAGDEVAQAASGQFGRLERNTAGAEQQLKEYEAQLKKAEEKFKKAQAKWDKLSDAEKQGNNPPQLEKPPEPAVSRDKEKAAYKIYEELKASPNFNTAQMKGHRELVAEVEKRLVDKALKEGVAQYQSEEKEKLIGQLFIEVINEKKTSREKAESVFDFKKDKAELEAKIGALTAEAQGANLEALVKKCGIIKENVGKLKEGDRAEKDMIQIWDEIGALEMEIFTAKRKAVVEKKPEKEIDIPDNVLADIFKDHPKEVAAAMRAIYEDELGAAEGGGRKTTDRVLETMKNLFGGKPDKAVLEKLMACGIRSWDQFKKMWDKKYAQESARILHAWAQDDLRGDVARRTTSWDRINAIKYQLAGRIALNIALVGGGAIAATALFASGGLAGIGLAAAGGAAGGGVRAALQKFLFGRRGFEERKQKQLLELANRKKQEAIAGLMEKRFGKAEDKFEAGTENMFASLVAEAIREVNAEAGKKEAVAGGPELAGKAKAIYIQRLKEFKWEGEEPTEEQKRQFAIAISILMEKGQAATQEAVRNADPLVVRMLDGIMAGYSGSKASSEKYGWKGAASTTALGAAAGVAFFSAQWQARAAMGALGGAAAGYHHGEGKRLGRLEKAAESQITERIKKVYEWKKDFENGTISPQDTGAFCEEIKKFNRYLKGTADSEAEENIVALLQNQERAVWRKEVENLVYEAYRRGLFARLAVIQMQERSDVIGEQGKMTGGDRFKKWIKKNGKRAAWMFGGAVAGAGLAILAGEGISFLREKAGIGPGSLGKKLGIEQAPTDKGAFGGKAAVGAAEVTAAGAVRARAGVGTEELAGADKTGATVETVQGTATISKGQGILHAANKIMHEQPKFFEGWSKQQVHDWKVQELQDMGFKFRGGKWGYPVTVHEGAKVNLVIGADGKPHLELGTEHVTEHKYYKWEETDVKAKQAEAHEAAHRREAVRMETAAEMRGEEVPLAEQKLTPAQLRAGEEIYTRVEELPKAGAAGVAGEEIIRHERVHKAYDELAAAKGKKASAMPQEEVVRKPRGARAKIEMAEPVKAGGAEVVRPPGTYNENVIDLHKQWDSVNLDLYQEDDAGVMEHLLRRIEGRMFTDPDFQHRIDELIHTGDQTQAERIAAVVNEFGTEQLAPEEKLALGHPFVDDDTEFVKLPIENPETGLLVGTAFVAKGDESHAMRIEMEDGTVRYSSSSDINYTPEKAEEILRESWRAAA